MQIELSELTSLLAGKQTTGTKSMGQNIVVLDRGFVYAGEVVIDGEFVYVGNCVNIRLWGTKNGLGELRNGPLSETKLDKVGEIIAPVKALIHLIPCKGF